MKKEAFTLLELIFVVMLIGILSGIGFYSFKPHYLRNDINFVLMKLEETRYQGMDYDKSRLSSGDSTGCISIDALNKSDDAAYKFHSTLKNRPFEVLCFDTLGRDHNGTQDSNTTTIDSLVHQNLTLVYGYNGEEANISIDYLSGNIRIIR